MLSSLMAGRSQTLMTSASRVLTRRGSSGTKNKSCHLTAVLSLITEDHQVRSFTSSSSSSSNNNNSSSNKGARHDNFTPRRRPSANYRPTKARGNRQQRKKGNKGFPFGHDKIHKFNDQIVDLGEQEPDDVGDGLSEEFGIHAAQGIRHMRRIQEKYKGRPETAEDFLRNMDYLTAEEGSTEDLIGERRALSFETESKEEKEQFIRDVDDMIERQRVADLELEPYEDPFEDDGTSQQVQFDRNDPLTGINPNQLAHGEWGELVIRVDRNIKLWRGGRIQSYRALVIGGNLNGCAGFGTGKASNARDAVVAASRKCKRNIFFVDRYQNCALTRDLVGRSNSCKVKLFASDRGLRGNPLACEILKYFGITNATAKAVHGNRSQFNVVRATFKALQTHESMEDIALKRGKRILSVDRGRKLQI